ncbi:MAG: DUF1080 domain-containing protein, partial [Armatimonadetes bacterium]|nr:DUF1080 domain-containing protein [Armatimonadota bacterium]
PAEGWIALLDGSSSYGWAPRGDAQWGVAGGQVQASSGGVGTLATTTHFAHFALRFECWADEDAAAGVAVRCPADGPITDTNCYVVKIGDKHPKWPTGSIAGLVQGRVRRATTGRWTPYEIRCEGNQINVLVDDRQASRLVHQAFAKGPIALVYGGSGSVKFRRVRLMPLGTKPLFNGKDLTGWKAVEGTQARVGVTSDGALFVRNGRGDLQTTEEFGDFALQMQIISNGTNLNSGIFFRANAGGFWSGYEAQIRNQWNGDNRSEPVDFGTGGIYNRQPARRVVSNDREWFTLTIVAHGAHIATWVDGIQVTDFRDTRPVDETNARKGTRTRAGVISIQGHDPTTDLCFRRIRISTYPESPPPK